jgi:transcriptional regulator with XRE-family HTH domain
MELLAKIGGVVEHVGEVIRNRRGELGITQEELAKRAGIAPTSVVRLESGEIRQPRISTIHRLSEALGMDAKELLGFVMSRPPVTKASPAGPFTAVYQRDEEWWIGYVEELPGANAQERTIEEARESLSEAVSDVLEANRELTRTEFEGRDVVREPLAV